MGSLNRTWISLATAVALTASSIAADSSQPADNTPTTVYVSAEQGMLYSGPGEDFYPTGTVAHNATLDVYLQAPGNWLGIRPPSGSFSWVQAADAYLLPGGRLIEITNPAAVSWIGTELGSAKQYRWQVKLTPGEQLGVIGEQTTRGDGDQEVLWYKIAPPAGEYRWIQATSVSTQPVSAARQRPPQKTSARSKKTRRSGSGVVPAGYQSGADSGVITLGNPADRDSTAPVIVSGDYPRTPQPGEIINGEVVVGDEYSPGEIIHEQATDGEYVEGSYPDTGYYDSDYVAGEHYAGEHYEGEYFEEGYMPGEIVDGGMLYGNSAEEVIYDGEDYIDGVVRSTSKGAFAGWHALELTDDGMRFTWLERLYSRARQNGPDPLQADPFSLAMNKGQVRPNSPLAIQQMYPGGMPQAHQATQVQNTAPAQPRRGHRPWRDPRMLGGARSSVRNSPSAAPTLSSRYGLDGDADLSPVTSEPAGLGAGLQRLAGAFNSGSSSLAAVHTEANNQAASDVNWYGLGSGKTQASLVSQQTNVTTAGESLAASSNTSLAQLQLSLSEAVAQPMQTWSLQSIYDEARYHVEHGASAIERGQARLLMERVEEFAELAARSGYLALNRSSLGNGVVNSMTAGSNTSTSPIMLVGATGGPLGGVERSDFQRAIDGGASYDATGWLVPVIAAEAGQPTHALTDDIGRIQAYVSPAPGLNLNRYINQAVGVTGLRGYLPQLQAGHIQASRIVRLQ